MVSHTLTYFSDTAPRIVPEYPLIVILIAADIRMVHKIVIVWPVCADPSLDFIDYVMYHRYDNAGVLLGRPVSF